MAPRSPRQTLSTLVLRGSLFHVLHVPFAHTLVSCSESSGTETLVVKRVGGGACTEQQVHRVFEKANQVVEDEERIVVVDVPMREAWNESEFACEIDEEGEECKKDSRETFRRESVWSGMRERVIMIDVPVWEAWNEPEFACKYAKYKPKPTDSVVRLVYIPEFALSAVPHDGTMGGEYLQNAGGCGLLKFAKFSYNEKKEELTLEYSLSTSASGLSDLAVVQKLDDWPDAELKTCIQRDDFGDASLENAENPPQASATDEQVVTPWTVDAGDKGVDYNKLLVLFGCERINVDLLDYFKQVTGHDPHPWLKREIFFSHRELKQALIAKQTGKPLYLYTGRGPSSESLHFGHLIPFMFTSWLQSVLDCPLVIQLTDDEKYIFQKDLNNPKPLDEYQRLGYENARDIMAVGFNPKKTFIFLNTEYMGHMYPLVCQIQKNVNFNQARGIFGFNGGSSMGQIAFPAIQAAPSFSECFPTVLKGWKRATCLIPCAIDQDPYFRMTRDVAKKIGLKKPALIHSKFFPALQGANAKMSGSIASSAIMVSDDAESIRRKISSAFSGGRSGPGQQEAHGADLEVDIAYQWLRFFLMDDVELARIARLYGPGDIPAGEKRMFTVEAKKILSDVIIGMAETHQRKKQALTQDQMNEVFSVRPIV